MSSTVAHVSIALTPDSPETKGDNHRSGRCSIIKEFFLNTSTHALPSIARSSSVHNRVFWSISFVGFTGIMIYFLVKAILVYLDYPTQIDIHLIEEWPQYFPAFTVCNAAPFRLDRFIGPFLNYTNSLNLTTSNDSSTWSSRESPYIRSFIINRFNENQSMEELTFPLASMLHSCSFNSVPCSAVDFIPFTSSYYGGCYTFNARWKNATNDSVRYGNYHGGDGVLDLGLYIHSHQYLPYFGSGIGLVTLVHDNTELPLISSAGIHLAPGKKHKLGYRKKTTYFLSAPYTTCTESISRAMRAMFDSFNAVDYAYSPTICLQLCQQAFIYEQCGCISPYLWNARSIVNTTSNEITVAPLCDRFNPCYQTALSELLGSSSPLTGNCSHCTPKCTITNFIIQTSSLNAPFQWQKNSIKAFVQGSTVPLPVDWSTNWASHIDANYVGVSLVRETAIVENNTQTATIGVVDVLSALGGQTGLWLGISFLSMMEVIEMLYRLVRFEIHRIRFALQHRE